MYCRMKCITHALQLLMRAISIHDHPLLTFCRGQRGALEIWVQNTHSGHLQGLK